MTTYSAQQKPSLVSAIAAMTMVSGIVNIFWGLIASMTALVTLVGVVCLPFTVLPSILGVFEIIYAAKLLGNPPQAVRPATTLAAFEIASILAGNAFSMIVGILALVFYNDLMVKAWFAEINGAQPPAAPAAPILPEPEASAEAPVETPAEAAPAEAAPVEPPAEEENPSNPRRPRKVA